MAIVNASRKYDNQAQRRVKAAVFHFDFNDFPTAQVAGAHTINLGTLPVDAIVLGAKAVIRTALVDPANAGVNAALTVTERTSGTTWAGLPFGLQGVAVVPAKVVDLPPTIATLEQHGTEPQVSVATTMPVGATVFPVFDLIVEYLDPNHKDGTYTNGF